MAHTLDGVSIPAGMVWIDEFDWSDAVQEVEHGITGALLVDAGQRLAGRPITLQGEDDSGWIERSVLASIQAKAGAAGVSYSFAHDDGRNFNVLILEISASPAVLVEDPPADWPYVATIRMIEV